MRGGRARPFSDGLGVPTSRPAIEVLPGGQSMQRLAAGTLLARVLAVVFISEILA